MERGSWLTLVVFVAGATAPAQDRPILPRSLQPSVAAKRTLAALDEAAGRERTSDDPEVRREAFQQIASGLTHREWCVWLRAAELLGSARDRERALDLLVVSAERISTAMDNRHVPMPEEPPRSRGGVDDISQRLAYQARAIDAAVSLLKVLEEGGAVANAHYRAFLAMPAAEKRRGLLALRRSFPAYTPEWLPSLLAVHDAEVILALADIHEATNRRIAEAQDRLLQAKRAVSRPNQWGEAKRKEWMAAEQKRIATDLADSKQQLENRRRLLAQFEQEIVRFAREQNLPAPPAGATIAAWRSWAQDASRIVAERAAR